MPYSKRQLRWANSPAGHKALGKEKVAEWNEEAKGKKLPERSGGKKHGRKKKGWDY